MSLRDAAQQALEALEASGLSAHKTKQAREAAITALRAALADTQDWDEIEALRASLREHMAEIYRLRAAGRKALGALQFCLPLIEDYGDEEQLAIHHKALAVLTEYAMQRLTDEQQMIERGTKAWASVPDASAWVEELRGNESVTDCHEKAADHIPDATKMMASINEMETVEPVAYVTGYRSGFCVINPVEPVVFPTGMALYRSPPKREPLTDEELYALGAESHEDIAFVRRVLAAHGIGGEE